MVKLRTWSIWGVWREFHGELTAKSPVVNSDLTANEKSFKRIRNASETKGKPKTKIIQI